MFRHEERTFTDLKTFHYVWLLQGYHIPTLPHTDEEDLPLSADPDTSAESVILLAIARLPVFTSITKSSDLESVSSCSEREELESEQEVEERDDEEERFDSVAATHEFLNGEGTTASHDN